MLLCELFETSSKHITFCFGRMNPPTVGHKKVFKVMDAQGGEMKIFLSQTKDKKENPLDYETKVEFIKMLFPEYAADIVEDTSLNTIGKVASSLYDQGYRHITFVAGEDRIHSFEKMLKDYNGVEGKAHGYYKFETLNFVSAGDRDPDSPGVEGISASKARAEAMAGNLDGFTKATGAGQYAEPLYNAVRDGLGLKKEEEDESE